MRKIIKFMQGLYKKIYKVLIALWIRLHERKWKYNNKRIKYIHLKNKSTTLCVVFAGFPELGKKPVYYNYLRTLGRLRNMDCLFLLDDMVNIPTGGSYYLGCNGNYWGLKYVPALIAEFQKAGGYQKLITAGSSKGGTCAILYGMLLHADYILAGACQYRIGTYLNCDYHIGSLRELTGENPVSKEAIETLDSILIDAIRNNKHKSKTKIFLHYSNKEHTYKEHIEELIADLKKYEYTLIENVESYTNHGDVGLYFPQYMVNILQNII